MKIPALVRSRKSSMKRSSQYCGGRPRGNTGCCSFLIIFVYMTLCELGAKLEFGHLPLEAALTTPRLFIQSPSFCSAMVMSMHFPWIQKRYKRHPTAQKTPLTSTTRTEHDSRFTGHQLGILVVVWSMSYMVIFSDHPLYMDRPRNYDGLAHRFKH